MSRAKRATKSKDRVIDAEGRYEGRVVGSERRNRGGRWDRTLQLSKAGKEGDYW